MATLKIYNRQFASGLIFLCMGVFAAVYAFQYRLGTATHMGPGYFPLGVALVLALLGLLTMIGGLRETRRLRRAQQSVRSRSVHSESAANAVEPGIAVLQPGEQDGDTEPAEFHVGMLVIIGGVVLFGEVLQRWGLVPAVGVVTVIVCYKRWRTRPIEVIVMALALMAVTAGLFVYLLGMPFTLFKI